MKTAMELATEQMSAFTRATSLYDDDEPLSFDVEEASAEYIRDQIAEAIEADRAQLEAEYAYQVVTGGTSRYPLAIVGAYRSEFEAKAVAKEWNRINNRYGIRYRVEVDS